MAGGVVGAGVTFAICGAVGTGGGAGVGAGVGGERQTAYSMAGEIHHGRVTPTSDSRYANSEVSKFTV